MRSPRSTRSAQGVDVRGIVFALAACVYVVVMLREFASVEQASHQAATMSTLRGGIDPDNAVATTEPPVAFVVPTIPATRRPTPAPGPPSQVVRGRRTMVLVGNYRDSKRCGETLHSLFQHAAEPQSLRVSVHDQIEEAIGELPCVDVYCQLAGERDCRRQQVFSTQVDAIEAKGPIVARSVEEKQIRDEEFCLGIDSHMVFTPNWDEKLVLQWEATENENAIITVYPKVTQYLTDHSKDDEMGIMCVARIEQPEADAMVQYRNVRWVPKDNTTKPRLQSQFAGGFNFGSCRAYTEVPNDPYMPILFYGEEYIRGARLWTSGFDFYAPSVDAVYHWYEPRKRLWEEDWTRRYKMLQSSKRRARAILGLPVSSQDFDMTDLEKYGLGTRRTFSQWKKFTGFDPRTPFTDKTKDQFENCGELQRVPLNN